MGDAVQGRLAVFGTRSRHGYGAPDSAEVMKVNNQLSTLPGVGIKAIISL